MNSAPLAIIETLGTGGAFDGVLSVYSEKKDPVGRQHALDSICCLYNMIPLYPSKKKRFYKSHILQNFHWAGRRVPLEGAFPAPVMATRRVANRLIFLIKPEVTTIDICHQAASGVGVECFCRPGWVGSDCGQRGRCG